MLSSNTMPSDILDLLDRHYAQELGCRAEDFKAGRLIVAANDRISNIRFAKGSPLAVYGIARPTGAVLAVLPKLKETAENAARGACRSPLDDDCCNAIERALGPLVSAREWFRGCRLYCTRETFIDRSFGEVRIVTLEDDWSRNLHRVWGGEVVGQIEGGRIVCYVAIKPLSEIAWDLSVETLPGYRGRGYAKSAVSIAAKIVFEHGKIATWGCDRTNEASLRTARSVGFQDYGLDFGCIGMMGDTQDHPGSNTM